jgi:uncharacterized membrane protein YoaK (UPF0700 family)
MVLLLAVAGGGVDAIIILAFQVLTGAQTGNTVMLAVALAEGRFAAGFYSAVSVASFIAGSVAGQLAMLRRKSESALGPIGWALIAELIPLSALLICWHLAQHPGPKVTAILIALAAGSMGMQSAAVLRLHGSPTTTYVTGTLITFSTDLTRWIFIKETGTIKETETGPIASQEGLSAETPVLYGLDWVVYVCGALASGLLYLWIRETALVLPMLAIAAVAFAERAT